MGSGGVECCRDALIGGALQESIQWELAQEGNTELLSQPGTATFAEEVFDMPAAGAAERKLMFSTTPRSATLTRRNIVALRRSPPAPVRAVWLPEQRPSAAPSVPSSTGLSPGARGQVED